MHFSKLLLITKHPLSSLLAAATERITPQYVKMHYHMQQYAHTSINIGLM